eukprot:11181280-Lingulodinium_polyedra.AAC.1
MINEYIRSRGFQCKCESMVKPLMEGRGDEWRRERAELTGDEYVDDAEWAMAGANAGKLMEEMLLLIDFGIPEIWTGGGLGHWKVIHDDHTKRKGS